MERAVISVVSNGSSTQDITHSGSWTPKAAILQWSRANTSADTFQEHASIGYGITDGTNQRAVATASEDNQARGDSAKIQRDDCLLVTLNPSGTIETVDSVATFNSWLSNGLRINWTDQPAANFYFTVTLFGGDDLTNVKVDTLMTGTGTGDVSYSSIAWQADYGMFLSGGTAIVNTPVIAGFLSVGMATGASGNVNQWVQSIHSVDNPVTMSTRQYYSHSNIVVSHTTSVNGLASFSGFNGTGFTINISDSFTSSFPIYFLLMKGGSYTVGNNTEPANTGQQTITTNADVKAVAIFGLDLGTADTVSNGCMWTGGWGDSSAQCCDVFEDTHGVADSIVVSRHDTNQIYLNITANATAASTTLDDEAALYSVSSTNFIADWTNIGQARPFRYATFGTGLSQVTKTLTLKHDIAQLTTKQLTLRHDINVLVTKSLTLRHDIAIEVTKLLTLRHDITADVLKTLTLLHSIDARVEKSLTLRHNITTVIDKSLTLRHNIGGELLAKVMTYQATYGSGTQDLTGTTFTPKAAIFFHTLSNAVDSFIEGFEIGFGFTDGTNDSCVTTSSEDNQTITDVGTTTLDSKCLYSMFVAGTLPYNNTSCSCQSWLSNGMRVTWANTLTYNFKFNVLFLGGSDIEAVKVGYFSVPTSPIGLKTISGVGFKPDLIILLSNVGGTSASNNAGPMILGAATDPGHQWTQSVWTSDAQGAGSCYNEFSHDMFLAYYSGTIQQMAFTLDSKTDDGFVINVTNVPSSTSYVHYLAIKGGHYVVGNQTEPSDTGEQRINTGLDTKALMMFGVGATSGPAAQTNARMSIGAASGASEMATVGVHDTHLADPTISTSRYETDSLFLRLTAAATASASTIDDEAALSSLDSSGATLSWSNVGSGLPYRFITLGSAEKFTKSLTLRHDITNDVLKSVTLRHEIFLDCLKSLTLRHDIEGRIFKKLKINFSIDPQPSSYIPASSLQDYTYHIILAQYLTQVTKQLTLLHNIEQQVTKPVTLRHDITADVQKSLTLLHNVEARVDKSLTLLHNVMMLVSKDLTLLHDIDAEITKSLTLRHDITTDVQKSVTLRHAIEQQITKSLTLLQNIEARVTKQLTLLYDIEVEGLTSVLKSLTLRHDIRQLTDKPLTLRHDINQLTDKSLTLRHDITQQVDKDITLKHNIEQFITKILTLRHDITADVLKSLTLRHDVTADLIKSLTLRHNITSDVQKSVTLRHDIIAQVTKQLTLLHNIIAQVTKTLTLLHDIESVAQVTKTLSLRHNIEQQITKQVTLLHNITTLVSKELTLIHDIAQEVDKSLTLRHDISAQLDKSLTLRHDVNEEVTKQLTLRHDILEEVTKSLTLLHNIEALLSVLKSLTLRHNVEARVDKSLTLRHNITQLVDKTLTVRHDILASVIKSVSLLYHIEAQVLKSLTMRFNVTVSVEKQLTLLHDIHSSVLRTITLRHDIEARVTKQLRLIYNITAIENEGELLESLELASAFYARKMETYVLYRTDESPP